MIFILNRKKIPRAPTPLGFPHVSTEGKGRSSIRRVFPRRLTAREIEEVTFMTRLLTPFKPFAVAWCAVTMVQKCHSQPPGMVQKSLVNHGKYTTNLNWVM